MVRERDLVARERERECDLNSRDVKPREIMNTSDPTPNRESELRDIRVAHEREFELLREREALEREMVIESMRGRERELREVRELRERAELAREREREREREQFLREQQQHHQVQQHQRNVMDARVQMLSTTPTFHHAHPHSHPTSPRSNTPPSPRMEKSVSPEAENRFSAWTGSEEFKHLLAAGGFPGVGHLDANGLYQPLRVCNRALASMNGLAAAPPHSAGPLAVNMPQQLAHLSAMTSPFFPRDLPPQAHPLLAARYPAFMHHRYPSEYCVCVCCPVRVS